MPGVRGVVLYSGGLDSLLASKLLIDQGIELTGLYCILPFFPPDLDPEELESSKQARQIGLKLVYYRCGKEYIEMLKNPPHGYGKHINPCIDCKLFFMKKAADLMKELGADFVATGEVVGQRPMSQQKHTMLHIEKVSGIKGRLLRPLSAKILEPTIPELEGKVDRSRLLNISGRGRKRQMELAESFGIENYSSPAGGCLFADRYYAERLRDLFAHKPDADDKDMYLLKIGRHFRINSSLKIIVARDESESLELEKAAYYTGFLLIPEFKGPSILIIGTINEEELILISSISARYGKVTEDENKLTLILRDKSSRKIDAAPPIDNIKLDSMRV